MNRTESKPTVLIVDDTPTNIQVLAEGLRADYRVKVAGSGKMALDIIAKQGAPDLVLLDVMMPDMDGYEVCRTLKRDPTTQSVPIIFVTAKTDTVDETFGLQLGAVDYIAKPFHLPIVLARIRNHIALKLKSDLLESLAMLDGLTNIPNRRRFDEHLDSEWKRAARAGAPLSILMIDIDFFKHYNDNYGHGAGDVCLRKVAGALSTAVVRPGDLVARYGGEEFVVLLPETAESGAVQIAERLRESVMNLKIPHAHSSAGTFVTVSIGVASGTPNGDATSTGIHEQADRELYRAKESGRNRVCAVSMIA
jgi:diguanylate cyclase (GGDEF)-like protein